MTNIKMKPEIKKAWIEALRSGEYTQTNGALRKDGTGEGPEGFCCLGVLCDLAVKAEVIPEPVAPEEGYDTWFYDDMEGTPSEKVLRWAGLLRDYGGEDGVLDVNDEGHFFDPEEDAQNSLASLNDDGMEFADIADLIEKHF